MKNGTGSSWRALKVGLVLTIALLLLVLAVTNSSYIRRLVTQDASLYATIPTVNGLHKGAPVWLQGIEIGSVHSLSLQPDGVVIRLSVQRSALFIVRKNAEATILTMGLLGDKYIELGRGTSDQPFLRDGDTLAGAIAPGFEQVLAASVGSVHLVEDFIRKLDTIAGKAVSGKGVIGALLSDTVLYHRINYVAGVIAKNAAEYDSGKGTIKQLLTDDSLYKELKRAVSLMDSLGLKANRGNGTMARLMNDSALYVNLNLTLLHLHTLADSLTTSAGSFNRLTNPRLAADVEQTVARLKELIEDIKKNPGRYLKMKIL